MCAICMGREEDVETYYEQLIKLVLAPPWVQDSFLRKIFRSGLWKKFKILISCMPMHTLEEVMESTRQLKDDMTSGRSRIRRKHRNLTSSSLSFASSSEKEETRSWRTRKRKRQRSKPKQVKRRP
jgi:hypothetical protein